MPRPTTSQNRHLTDNCLPPNIPRIEDGICADHIGALDRTVGGDSAGNRWHCVQAEMAPRHRDVGFRDHARLLSSKGQSLQQSDGRLRINGDLRREVLQLFQWCFVTPRVSIHARGHDAAIRQYWFPLSDRQSSLPTSSRLTSPQQRATSAACPQWPHCRSSTMRSFYDCLGKFTRCRACAALSLTSLRLPRLAPSLQQT